MILWYIAATGGAAIKTFQLFRDGFQTFSGYFKRFWYLLKTFWQKIENGQQGT